MSIKRVTRSITLRATSNGVSAFCCGRGSREHNGRILATVEAQPCGHMIFCTACAARAIWHTAHDLCCPVCGIIAASIRSHDGALTPENVFEQRLGTALSQYTAQLGITFARQAEQLLSVMSTARIADATPIVDELVISFRTAIRVSIEYEPLFPLLTVDACESLLAQAAAFQFYDLLGGDRLRHALVAMCRLPWRVDVALGSDGVCYYGNMGERPSILGACALIMRNMLYATGRASFF